MGGPAGMEGNGNQGGYHDEEQGDRRVSVYFTEEGQSESSQ